jgi:hypothetical protein
MWRMVYMLILRGVGWRMAAHSIVLSCGIGRGQVRGDRPMHAAKCGAATHRSC